MPLFKPPDVDKMQANQNIKGLCKALTDPDTVVRIRAAAALRQSLGGAGAAESATTRRTVPAAERMGPQGSTGAGGASAPGRAWPPGAVGSTPRGARTRTRTEP